MKGYAHPRQGARLGNAMVLEITPNLSIEEWEMTEHFTRASGPGGQNVNKVATAVVLRFEAERSPNLPAGAKARLRRKAAHLWTKEGALVIHCDETRHQARNRELARARLARLIADALHRPKPRIATKPTKGSIERRLTGKKKRASVKQKRQSRDYSAEL